jgi:hypothetical protein
MVVAAPKDEGICRGEAMMATSTDRPSQAPMTTKVTELPPMTVTTEGIPATEHVTPPVAERERRTRWIALAMAGVLAIVAVVALVLGAVLTTPGSYEQRTVATPPRAGEFFLPTVAPVHTADWATYRAGERAVPAWDQYMGLTQAEWGAYRTGERAVTPAADLHMGLTSAAWLDYRTGERVA